MKNELAKMAKRYNEIYYDFRNGLCGISTADGHPCVHLTERGLKRMFPNATPIYKADEELNYYKKYVVYDGVEFFCVLNSKEEYEDETF